MTVRGVFLLIRLTRRRGRRAADYMRDRCRGQVLRDSRVSADRHAEDHMDRAFTRSRFAGGSGFSDDFASAVAAVGGTVERLHQGAGFAVVSGLSTAGARSWLPTSALRRWTPTPWSHAIRQCRRRSRRHRPSAARAVRTLRVRSIRRTRSCFPSSGTCGRSAPMSRGRTANSVILESRSRSSIPALTMTIRTRAA